MLPNLEELDVRFNLLASIHEVVRLSGAPPRLLSHQQHVNTASIHRTRSLSGLFVVRTAWHACHESWCTAFNSFAGTKGTTVLGLQRI